ncbi:MAG: Gfo/Idh/MocA family oxidoreductase [Anaerolineae bacterium]|nr:Gfo/Idh/MocA family oxidoreductase [Anaerolineae bacterium]
MTLKIGLIGCGGIMHAHVEGWKKVAGRADIVAMADISEENARVRMKQYGRDVAYYADYHDLLADPSIDAVDIALPHFLHRDSIVESAQAGKHLMTEKPLCLNLAEADDIVNAVKSSGITMMAGHNQLFFPTVLKAKQMIMLGDIGKVYSVNTMDAGARRGGLSLDKSSWGKAAARRATWRSDPAKMGGGELIDTGYHPAYRLLFLAGQMPVEVSATLGNYRIPMDEEDTAQLSVKFADGAMGSIFTSWAIAAPGCGPTLFSIQAEAGQLWGESNKLYYQPVGFQTPAVTEYPGWDYDRTFAAEIAHLIDAIEGGFEPLHSAQEAADTLRLILAGYKSAQEGIIVKL